MTSLTSSLEIDQTYSFILSTMMTNRPSITPLHLAASARCGLRKCPGQGHIWQKGGPVQRCIWWATWVIFRLQKKQSCIHLISCNIAPCLVKLGKSPSAPDLQIFGPAKNWALSLGKNPSNQRKRTARFKWCKLALGISTTFPLKTVRILQVGFRWTCRPSSIIDRMRFSRLVFFEKSGFFGWNQGIQSSSLPPLKSSKKRELRRL